MNLNRLEAQRLSFLLVWLPELQVFRETSFQARKVGKNQFQDLEFHTEAMSALSFGQKESLKMFKEVRFLTWIR